MRDWHSERSRNGGVDEVPLPGATGRLWLCGKHFIGPDHVSAAARVGADVVVCLCHGHELEDRYPGYVEWLTGSGGAGADPGAAGDDLMAVWRPVHDLHAPSAEQALELVETVAAHLDAGRSVLVHCGAGIGRAGTLAAAVLMRQGLSRQEALERVAASRPMAGPEAGPQSDLLVELEGRYRRPAPGGVDGVQVNG
ncbi:MAG TPA: dual specificity protein phosphatase family protein [Acidimicrobiales bacterium]|nr:dual specificity protein phosphatase family protein [Acidimicrobiales bacterium]